MDMGTVIDEAAAQSFEAKVNDAVARGARLLYGNVRRGALYSPTLLDRVTPDMPVVKYETFGPVSPVIRFSGHRRRDPDRQLDRLRAVVVRCAPTASTTSRGS